MRCWSADPRDGTRIELVAGRQVEALLKKNIGLYHLCFEVEDIDAEIGRLVEGGARLIVRRQSRRCSSMAELLPSCMSTMG